MSDQVIDSDMAHAIQVDANRENVLFAWIVQHNVPEHPRKFIARLTLEHPTIYVLVAETLAELHAMLPLGMDHSLRASPAIRLTWWRSGSHLRDTRERHTGEWHRRLTSGANLIRRIKSVRYYIAMYTLRFLSVYFNML